jgi:hypothetical protein
MASPLSKNKAYFTIFHAVLVVLVQKKEKSKTTFGFNKISCSKFDEIRFKDTREM